MPKHMTKDQLARLKGFPEIHKKFIEKAIYEMTIPDDPKDAVWPDYFRAEMVEVQQACVISEKDELYDGEYETEAAWFEAGWKAKPPRSK